MHKIIFGDDEILDAHMLEATHFSLEEVASTIISHGGGIDLYVTEDIQIPVRILLFCSQVTVLTNGDRADIFKLEA